MSKLTWLGLLPVALVVGVPAHAAPGDRMFLRDAVGGNLGETRIGQLAAQRGASSSARAYGRTLAADHSAALRQSQAVARRLGYPVPARAKPDSQHNYAMLSRLRGPQFDRELKRMMIEDHQKDIAEYQAAASGNGDRRVRDYARASLPVLRKHLQMARAL